MVSISTNELTNKEQNINKDSQNSIGKNKDDLTGNSSHAEPTSAPDPQVKESEKRKRKTYSKSFKLRILRELDACSSSSERGAILRREGLYTSHISNWKKEHAAGFLNATKPSKDKKAQKNLALHQENNRLKKQLAQAEAIIDIQKKISELFGQSILPHESSEAS